jgi:hypothetical protein
MFQTGLKIAFVSVPIHPDMHTISIRLPHLPLSHVTVTLATLPHPRTMLQSVHPLPLVKFAITPSIFTDPFRLSVHVLPVIDTAVGKLLEAQSLLVIALPITLIDSLVLVKHNSLAVPLAINDLPVIGRLPKFLQFECGGNS